MVGFIKDLNFLQEYNNPKDLFGYSKHARGLYAYLVSLPKEASIIALVGPYGIGKSFLVNLIREIFKEEKKAHWFNFEAWRYEDRKDLWKAFIAELGEDVAETLYKRQIQRYPRKLLNDLRDLWSGTNHMMLALILAVVFTAIGLSNAFEDASFMEAATFVAAVFALMFAVLGLYLRDPLRRQEGYERSLKDIIRKLDKEGYQKLYVVLEDVDRSMDQGLLFIETLSLFLRRFCPKDLASLSVKFIVPISDQSFKLPSRNASLLKAVDYSYPFNVKQLDIKGLVAKVFKKEFAEIKMQGYADKLFNILFASRHNRLNLRTWKIILRGANYRYTHLKETKKFKVQPIICIAVEMMKYYRLNVDRSDETTLFDQALSRGLIDNHELVRLFVYSEKQIDIEEDTNFTWLNVAPSIQISDNPDLIKVGSGFQIGGIDEKRHFGSELLLARCYFDEFQNANTE